MTQSHFAVGLGKRWITFNRLRQMLPGEALSFLVETTGINCALHVIQGNETLKSGGLASITPGLAESAAIAGRKRSYDHAGDFVLDREDIGQLPVIDLGPKLPIVGSVDKLDRDADAVTSFLNASLYDVAN
ncbi:hypothetical protein EJ069_10970 [Mesorhizobium sp. M2A.F.Ca.ET.043.05.1.1]|uniref:hypothetical protein n=1 Tax=Mesorhizobium sp. M2A.F.Ca.ET.043.05.1.1 TaxID=2493671 RepID=UPI000F75E5D0|nr:hypothetical protein [Mesorhizobium sp. M2A.F.Ca.ET.043.05.1.1]AZO15208.1 hypothetical protein EJ069_10970 [Mesorhizobium sp. M2A.F.Ca.ET.043.05.1.1]